MTKEQFKQIFAEALQISFMAMIWELSILLKPIKQRFDELLRKTINEFSVLFEGIFEVFALQSSYSKR